MLGRVDTRNQSRKAPLIRANERGATSIQIIVILVPVLFGFMGFAVDLGRMYLIRGELNTAANAMAIAAAGRLIGTGQSTTDAVAAAHLTIDNAGGFANKYDFGGLAIGESSGLLTSQVDEPAFYDSRAAAIGEGDAAGGSQATGSTAKHVRVTLQADAPLIFWSFLSLGQSRRAPIAAKAVAGMSAPLCTACGVEPFAVAALDAGDTTNFGFSANTRYTLGYLCNGLGTPGLLQGTTARVPYLILNRLDEEATLFTDEASQIYRIGAQGLLPSKTAAKACIVANAEESIWVTAAPLACAQNRVPATVSSMLCGLASRFDPTTIPTVCASIPEVETIATAYVADTDLTDLDDYVAYTGNLRRVITVPVVQSLAAAGTMTILGFRQFLVEPNFGTTTVNPSDQNGRFVGLYIGSVVPVKQGSFSGCQLAAGPGKVVLHQ
ncbi:MAG TPA: pilus assembly protein TadG-related protein [Bryobacteraceae bacterium]|nr:pilus assembly protein TadG-related protein [Bryobacteraceae bacterium]